MTRAQPRRAGLAVAFGCAALALSSLPAAAQVIGNAPPATTSVQLTAVLIKGLTIFSETPLDFGTLAASADLGGEVTVTPSGLVSTTQQSLLAPTGDARRPGVFRVIGQPNAVYAVLLPPSTTLRSATGTMPVTNFSFGVEGDTLGGLGRLDASGVQLLSVGATLTVAADQPAGDYVGTYPVTVTYQ